MPLQVHTLTTGLNLAHSASGRESERQAHLGSKAIRPPKRAVNISRLISRSTEQAGSSGSEDNGRTKTAVRAVIATVPVPSAIEPMVTATVEPVVETVNMETSS
jgi:hypothetical protein